jgi:hypothetical protein
VLWTADEIPIPSPADLGYLLFPPLMLAGIWSLLRARPRAWARSCGRTGSPPRSRLAPPAPRSSSQPCTTRSGQALEVAVGLAYPITDLVPARA